MIRTDKEYNEAKTLLAQQKKAFVDQKKRLESMKLTPAQVKMGMDPIQTIHDQLSEEVVWYERIKKGNFKPSTEPAQIGRTLISIRIAKDMSQRDLARKLGIPESQLSRDERNEYRGISIDRAGKVLAALGAHVTLSYEWAQRRAA